MSTADLAKLSKPELIKHIQTLDTELAAAKQELAAARQAAEGWRKQATTAPMRVHAPVAGAPTFTPNQLAEAHNEGIDRCAKLVGRDSSLFNKFLVMKR